MADEVVCAHSARIDTAAALEELAPTLSIEDSVAVLFFCSANHDGEAIFAALKILAPRAEIIGCTTAGEFTHQSYGQQGVVVVALPPSKVKRCASALAELGGGQTVEASVNAAARSMADKLGVDLRELDPERHVGIVLNEALHGREEEVNAVLGHVAPFLSFVGGSAGDNLAVKETKVFHDGRACTDGSVFLLMELAVPYQIVKTCSLEPTDTVFQIGRVEGRVVFEIDGMPAAARYAEKVGVPVEELGHGVFMSNPVGLMIEGEPWVRSPIMVTPEGGLLFGAQIFAGSQLRLLRPSDLVGDTARALAEGAEKLGRAPSAGLVFNCAHRCVEIDVKTLQAGFRAAISRFPVAGFHSYGESWLGHMNQMMVALLLG